MEGMYHEPVSVEMIHFMCDACGITATCIDNEAAWSAWGEHMEGHDPGAQYGSWTWAVVPLEL